MTERADVSQVPRKSGVRLARGCVAVVERMLIPLLRPLLRFRLYAIIRNIPPRFTLYRSDGSLPTAFLPDRTTEPLRVTGMVPKADAARRVMAELGLLGLEQSPRSPRTR